MTWHHSTVCSISLIIIIAMWTTADFFIKNLILHVLSILRSTLQSKLKLHRESHGHTIMSVCTVYRWIRQYNACVKCTHYFLSNGQDDFMLNITLYWVNICHHASIGLHNTFVCFFMCLKIMTAIISSSHSSQQKLIYPLNIHIYKYLNRSSPISTNMHCK